MWCSLKTTDRTKTKAQKNSKQNKKTSQQNVASSSKPHSVVTVTGWLSLNNWGQSFVAFTFQTTVSQSVLKDCDWSI